MCRRTQTSCVHIVLGLITTDVASGCHTYSPLFKDRYHEIEKTPARVEMKVAVYGIFPRRFIEYFLLITTIISIRSIRCNYIEAFFHIFRSLSAKRGAFLPFHYPLSKRFLNYIPI